MKRVLIISMSRMGDLLQTLPVSQALKEKYGDTIEISLIARKNFSSVVKGVSYIDELIEFDTEKQISDGIYGGINNYRKSIESFVDELNSKEYDEVINLTFSPLSAYLTYLVNARVKKGLNVSESGKIFHDGLWSNYFNGAVLNRTINSVNLVDIFLNIAEVLPSANSFLTPCANETKVCKFEKSINDRSCVIVYQMGASSENKRWPVRFFVSLTKLMLKSIDFASENLKIVLIGSINEKHLADEFKFLLKRDLFEGLVKNLIGILEVSSLWGVLKRADLLVTNDTGPMHIAALCNTPIVNISLGPVRFHETGPYSSNSIVVSPKINCSPCSFDTRCLDQKCKMYIKPKDVLNAIKILSDLRVSRLKLFSKVNTEFSGYCNFYYTQKIYREDSPRRIELIALNKIELTSEIISRVICNMALNKDMTFNNVALKRIIQRLKKYDFSNFDFKKFKTIHYRLNELKKFIKYGEKVNNNILMKLFCDHKTKKTLNIFEEEKILFEIDVKIASFQNYSEVFKFVLGVFLSQKAGLSGASIDIAEKNKIIYTWLNNSINTLSLICEKVYFEFNKLGEPCLDYTFINNKNVNSVHKHG